MWEKIKDKQLTEILLQIGSLLLILICCSGMSRLMEFRIYMIGIFGLCMYFRELLTRENIYISPIGLLQLGFIIICIMGIFYSMNRSETIKYSLVYLCMFPIFIFTYTEKFFHSVCKGFQIATLVVAVSIILNSLLPSLFLTTLNFLIRPGMQPWLYGEIMSKFYSGIAGEKGEAAILMVLGVALTLSKFVGKNRVTTRDFIFLLVYMFALTLPAKRTLFAIGIALCIVYMLFFTERKKKIIAIGMGLILLLVVIIFAEKIPGINNLLVRFTENSEDSSLNGRSYLWERAIQMIESKPFIGYGYGSYNTFASIYGVRTSSTGDWAFHAHNIYLQVLAETGLIGGLVLFSGMLFSLVQLVLLYFRRKFLTDSQRELMAFALFMQLCFLVYGVTGNILYGTNQMCLFLFTFGIVIYLERQYRREVKR